ncbi:MAG TPA: DsbE family thiol:disulfide interchange protein [Stellaceae bacterium]|nr:DsbE family thiol:disulfide interchange protein [Stellaceae bacterium]
MGHAAEPTSPSRRDATGPSLSPLKGGEGHGRRWLALAPLAGFLVLVGFFVASLLSGRNPAVLPSAMIDRPVPSFDLPPLEDAKPGLKSGDLSGKPVLVNFFASWCAPCREEHGTWAGYEAAGGVPLYGIAYKDVSANSKRFLAELGDPYQRVAVDRDGRTAIDFGVYGVPETYIVDAAGRIRFRYAGPVTPEILKDEILPRLARLEAGK